MSAEFPTVAALVISLLAFGTSLFSLGWAVYRDVIDRGKLRLELMIGRLHPADAGAAPTFIEAELYREMRSKGEIEELPGPDLLVATITNIGLRAIKATKWAGRTSLSGHGKWFVFRARTMPRTLAPGDYTLEWTDNPMVFASNVIGFYVYDSVGSSWQVTRENLREVQDQARRLGLVAKQGGRAS